MFAAFGGHVSVADALLEHNAQVDLQDTVSQSYLVFSFIHGFA